MKNILPRGLRREEFVDSDTWSEALYYAGLQPKDGYELGLVTGKFGEILRITYGEDPHDADTYGNEEWLQRQQPNIFVRKLRSRPGSGRKPPPRRDESSDSTFITREEFARQYAAVAFAAQCDLSCETAVTLWWRELGAEDAASATRLFGTFLKCLNGWLSDREMPTVYFYCHENSGRAGLHTHLAVYLGQCLTKASKFRKQFLDWRTDWVRNHAPGARPGRAARITGPSRSDGRWHWQRFHYQMKGYDPHAVVRTAFNTTNGVDVMLGDLIAWPWHDPGVVGMKPRVGYALNLGPERRRRGIPQGCDDLLSVERARERERRNQLTRTSPFAPPSTAPASSHMARSGGTPYRIAFDVPLGRAWEQPRREPFVSRYEDGWRDVWNLYPPHFCEWVMRVSYADLTRPREPWRRHPSDPLWAPYELPEDFLGNISG